MIEREYFFALADELGARCDEGETVLLRVRGEASDFIRYNATRVRQAGHVRQARLGLTLIDGRRQASAALDLSAVMDTDVLTARRMLDDLRDQIALMPEDPFLNFATGNETTQRSESAHLPTAGDAGDAIAAAFDGLDLTGIWACGETFAGFANSAGQRNWHAVGTFNFDWSVHRNGQSVKRSLAGPVFDAGAVKHQAEDAARTLELLSRTPKVLAPGRYRAYFAPEALAELLGLVAYGGFGLKSHQSGRSPLSKLKNGGARLDARVSLDEDTASGFAPVFTGEGFIKPARVPLIEAGRFGQCLVDARSAREFDRPVNAAGEAPLSLCMAPGTLAGDEVLEALGTGLYVSNVWYCNFSDRNDCRITGMTRFACLWVENGIPRGPVEPMRFDDTLYRILGDRLVDLSADRRLMLDPDTYEGRSFASMRLPGALVDGLALAL